MPSQKNERELFGKDVQEVFSQMSPILTSWLNKGRRPAAFVGAASWLIVVALALCREEQRDEMLARWLTVTQSEFARACSLMDEHGWSWGDEPDDGQWEALVASRHDEDNERPGARVDV